ncbi:MAG: protein-glutamate O-methyltransferase CheR [Proteobacteria bacterium]|nr:protein-glutamate O-methyltransferase CheR [Pseudomonadota bacterium]MBU1583403.1 protein-glutamate O-methyltransferase CheR [Pseudomonadota bacterium]MBU2452416.1 protein-glutamate O-methyltransferase CheR [Pseudomonadota bacterium]MBU2628900.1 protein-glutamate O-methyltransferase CheR [Pseudomonadota bacterium]
MTKIKITPEEFKIFSKYILDISGIALDVGKEYLIETRLNPLVNKLECTSYSQLLQKAKADFKKTIENEIIDAISTNETYFFRDKSPFELLQHKIFPDLIDKRSKTSPSSKPSIRLWSAANSTGQEIYSIAMTLIEMGVTPDKYNIRLFGTDISDAAIAQASYGSYNKFEVARGLDPRRLLRYFEPKEDRYKIKDEVRVMAQFKKMNLMKPFIGLGKFDIILCRNVMIYFTSEDRRKIYHNISKVLEPDGYLMIGSTESLVNDIDLFASKKYLNSVFYQFKE